MKITIMTKDTFIVERRTKYIEIPHRTFTHFYYNLKIDNWEDFINYVKKYKNFKKNLDNN